MNDNTSNKLASSRIPPTSPGFIHDEFLSINVAIDVDRRAREHIVSELQHNSIEFTRAVGWFIRLRTSCKPSFNNGYGCHWCF